jgi:hypothetical protein
MLRVGKESKIKILFIVFYIVNFFCRITANSKKREKLAFSSSNANQKRIYTVLQA